MTKKFCGTNYPVSICFVVVNEFCERFSYYGMRAVLTLYFLTYLHWDKDLSTAVYHAFSSLCYFSPVLGAILADSWLGKFKTIIYLSIVYVIGHVVKSVGAIPSVGDKDMHISLCMIGLTLIALGTGGIKPCVSAFGGDQFEDEHINERQKFFSIFYMSINAGSLLSTVITPILRGDVQCFGGDCYALAFGVPAALMVLALFVFIAGSGLYKMNPSRGNILLEVCNCTGFALKNRWKASKNNPRREHWLDWAEEKYSKRLIQEIKMVLRVFVLYISLPMFWALFDQQGSRWTLQATMMDMAFGDYFIIKPDQMQMLNALLILVFVPVFDLIVYPLVSLCRINITPLRKMATGMIFAALAFGVAAVVEVNVVKTVVDPAPAGECLLQPFNLAKGNVSVKIPGSSLFPEPVSYLQDPAKYERLPLGGSKKELTIQVTFDGTTSECNQTFEEEKAYSLFFYPETTGIKCKLVDDNIIKSEDGNPLLRFFNTQPVAMNLTVGDVTFRVPSGYSMTTNMTVDQGQYQDVRCSSNSEKCSSLNLGLLDFGASYTVILIQGSDKTVAHKMEDVKANDVHIAWQVPQYILITAGEVMFSITGLEFSYSQAPATMKSVMQAGWLLTVAFGNMIVLIVAEGAGLEQWKEFLLFAILLLGVCIIFSIQCCFYTYIDPDELDKINLEDAEKDLDDDDDDDNNDNRKRSSNDVYLNTMEKSTRL